MKHGIPPLRGVVVLEARNDRGVVVDRRTYRNTYTTVGAQEHAKRLAGEASATIIDRLSLGVGGIIVSTCEATTGWTNSTLDTVLYKQGTGSLLATTTTTKTAYHATSVGSANGTGGTLLAWIRVSLVAAANLAASKLHIYTGGTTANRFDVSLAAIEALTGQAIQDGTWRLVSVPVSAFSVGAGSPVWTAITGAGFTIASLSGTSVTMNVDDVRIDLPVNTTVTATTVPNERATVATSSSRTGLVVLAEGYWTTAQAVGNFLVAGLWSGSVLVAILPLDYYKASGISLRVTWSLTATGG